MQGKIIRWDNERGFGFVKESITGTEIFIHISALNIRNPPPEIGENIEFETVFNEEKGKTEVKYAVYLNRKMTLELFKKSKKHHLPKNTYNQKQYRSKYYSRENRQPQKNRAQKQKYNSWLLILIALIIVIIVIVFL